MTQMTVQAKYVIQNTFDLLRRADQKIIDSAVRLTPEYKPSATQTPNPKFLSEHHAMFKLVKSLREELIDNMDHLFDLPKEEIREMSLRRE